MVSIIEGARHEVVKEFEDMGSRLIIIFMSPDERKKGEGWSHVEFLTVKDAEAIREECPLVDEISPELPLENTVFEAGGEKVTGKLVGCQPGSARLHNLKLQSGRFFSHKEYDDWRKVCVIGPDVKKRLWPDETAEGRTLRASGVTFTVIGVTQSKGRSMGQDVDKDVYAPLTTCQKRITGDDSVYVMWAQTRSVEETEEVADQIWKVLMRRHDNQPDFTVDSQSRMLDAIFRILAIFGAVLGGVGGLALLVGGIGIMNIMLVSVTERTREIGLRKALGAKRRHIMVQFLTEAATLSGIGGLLGIALGAGLAWLVGVIMKGNMPTHVPLYVAVVGFFFACGVGIFFGLYPAWRAARLDPIEALRRE
jgi:putative ABC transport system permease protein